MGVRCMPAHLVVGRTGDQTGGGDRHQDGADLATAARVPVSGECGDGDQLGDVGARVRDELLGPVDDPRTLVQSGGGAGAAGVAPRARFREAEGAQRPARAEAGEPFLLLALVAEAEDRHGAERDPGLERDGDGLVDPSELLEGQAQDEQIAAHAAVFFGKGQAEETELTHLPHDFVGEGLGGVVVGGHRGDHVTGERRHGLAQLLLLRVQDRPRHGADFRSAFGENAATTRDGLGRPSCSDIQRLVAQRASRSTPEAIPRPSSCQTRSSVARLPVALPA